MRNEVIANKYIFVSNADTYDSGLRDVFGRLSNARHTHKETDMTKKNVIHILAFLMAGMLVGTVTGIIVTMLGATLLGALAVYGAAGLLAFVALSKLLQQIESR